MIVGIIGGSGITEALLEGERASHVVETACGAAVVTRGAVGGQPVAFIARHGEGHGLLPHQVNYRAHALALSSLGVTRVLATSACGSLRPDLPPGSLALLTDFIDFTRGRPWTISDFGFRISDFGPEPAHAAPGDALELATAEGPGNPPSQIRNPKSEIRNPATRFHLDMAEPYCPALRSAVAAAASELSVPLHPRAVYLCVEGPRYETHAEIRMFQAWGADLVGMTGVPEVTLARELGQCYASIAVVTNAAAGLTADKLDHADVEARVASVRTHLTALLRAALPLIAALPPCTHL